MLAYQPTSLFHAHARRAPVTIVLFATAWLASIGLSPFGLPLAWADDWPQWRGPLRNGVVESPQQLANSFTGQTPIWTSEPIASGDRGGRGSLVVDDGRIYGLTSIEQQSMLAAELFCLDAETGATHWRVRLAEPPSKHSGSATPCIDHGRLYVAGPGSHVHCLDVATGQTRWSTRLPRIESEPIESSAVVVDSMVIVAADALFGLDAESGQIRWQQGEVAGREASPTVWHGPDRSELICNSLRQTHGVDPSTGEILWTVPGGGMSTPVVAVEYGGDFLVTMSGSRKNGLTAYRLTATGPEQIWTVRVFDRAASPVVFAGHVYAIAGGSNGHGAKILCVHVDTGLVAWEETIPFAEVSSPVVADGKLIAVCGSMLSIFEAAPDRYQVLSQAECRITLCTSPAVWNGYLYLRQANAVVCYDLR